MTTINQARKAIYDKFLADWGATTPFVMDNEEFDEPQTAQWARLSVKGMPNSDLTLGRIGNRKFTREGILFIQIFVPAEEGTSNGDALATQARNIFEGERVNGVWFTSMDVSEPGSDGKWYPYLIQGIFNYEQVK